MGKLASHIQTFVIQALASFDAPSAVALAVKEEFGIEITRQAVQAYDPTKHAGRDLPPRWRELFWTTRTAFLADTAQIGISHRAVRLRALQRLARLAEGDGKLDLAIKALETAAREVGDCYTNKRHVAVEPTPDNAIAARRQELLARLRTLADPRSRTGH